MNTHNRKIHSIRKRLAIIYIFIMAMTILLCFVINSLFLQKYYLKTKQNSVINAYNIINKMIVEFDGDFESDEFNFEFMQLCNADNLNVTIVDSSFDVKKSNIKESKFSIDRLLSYIFKNDPNFTFENDDLIQEQDKSKKDRFYNKMISSTEDYSIYLSMDPILSSDYIELWGTLDDGNMILIQSAVESIRESVNVSNRFLLYCGIGAIAIGAFIIWIITKQITDPIEDITDISIRMANLDFDAKYKGKNDTEIGVLGEQINALSEKLENTISELKTANNDLKYDLEKKEQIDVMRREFVSNVSHELKTPIAIIQGYAEGLKEGVADNPEEIDYYCDVIFDETKKMNHIVKNLLTLTQYEFGTEPIEMSRFDIVTMIDNCLKSYELIAKEKEIKIEFENKNSVFVWMDEYLVEEIFTNYMSNAINHSSGDKNIKISVITKNDIARISVFNTGEQIPEDAIDKIWNKFYKIDKARSREYGGSGVGLSIVKAIMEKIHRDYGIINHENGVEFYFELDCKHL